MFLNFHPKKVTRFLWGKNHGLSTSQRLLAPPTLDLWCTKCRPRRARQQQTLSRSQVGTRMVTKNQWTRDGKGWFLKNLHNSWNCHFFCFFVFFSVWLLSHLKSKQKQRRSFKGFLVEINGQQVRLEVLLLQRWTSGPTRRTRIRSRRTPPKRSRSWKRSEKSDRRSWHVLDESMQMYMVYIYIYIHIYIVHVHVHMYLWK